MLLVEVQAFLVACLCQLNTLLLVTFYWHRVAYSTKNVDMSGRSVFYLWFRFFSSTVYLYTIFILNK